MVALASGVSVASAAPGLVILVGQAMGAETSLRGTWPCSASRASAPQTILIPSVTTVLLQPTLCPSPPPLHQHPSGSWKTRYRLPCFQYLHLLFFPLTLAFSDRGKKEKILVANNSKDRGHRCPQSWLPLPSSRATLISWQAAAQKMLPASESRGAALGPAPSSLLLLEPLSLPGQKLWSVCPPVLLPPPLWGLFLASEPLGRPVPAGSWWPPSCPRQIPRPAASHGPRETLHRLETTSHDPTAGRQRNRGSEEWAVGSQDYSVSCLLSQSFLVVVLLSFFFTTPQCFKNYAVI